MGTRAVVYLLDDEESVVTALARMLQPEPYDIRPFTSASEFLESHDPEAPGCLVTDLVMPDINGLDVQRLLSERQCRRSVVFITGQGKIPTMVEAMRAGAVTFLSKPIHRAQLVPAVHEAIARDIVARKIYRERVSVQDRLNRLTPRERQVLGMVIVGFRNKQVAAKLGIAEKTIKVHRARIMEKMQVGSVAALVTMLSRVTLGALLEREPLRSIGRADDIGLLGIWQPYAHAPEPKLHC